MRLGVALSLVRAFSVENIHRHGAVPRAQFPLPHREVLVVDVVVGIVATVVIDVIEAIPLISVVVAVAAMACEEIRSVDTVKPRSGTSPGRATVADATVCEEGVGVAAVTVVDVIIALIAQGSAPASTWRQREIQVPGHGSCRGGYGRVEGFNNRGNDEVMRPLPPKLRRRHRLVERRLDGRSHGDVFLSTLVDTESLGC